MAIAKTDLDLIKSKVDIVTLLESRGVELRPSGNDYTGLCPLHNERTPSFHVKSDTQTFRCFGCQKAGDIFQLLIEWDALSFPGAVQELAEIAGVELQGEEDPEYERRKRMLGIMRLTSEWFRRNYLELPMEHPAKQNMVQRKLYDYSLGDDTIGFAPRGGLMNLMSSRGIKQSELIEVGLLRESQDPEKPPVELFRNRLTWTLTDIQGRPIGFSARKIYDEDTGPKYINSPQTPLYNKSQTLLGLADAKKVIASDQIVYVVEGQSDVNALKAAGFLNTVASCGTAFGTEHANILLRLSKMGRASHTFKIVFCFDGDAAGTKAAKRVFAENQNLHVNSYVVQFKNPDGSPTDPCDYRGDYGDDKVRELITTTQVNIVEFILTQELENWDTTTPEGQSNYIREARNILALITDRIQHAAYLRKISGWTGIPLSEIEHMLHHRPNRTQSAETVQSPAQEQSQEKPLVAPGEDKLVAALLQYPTETLAGLDQQGITLSYFESNQEFLTKLVNTLQAGETLDYNNPKIVELLHLDTGILPNRIEHGVLFLLKNLLKYRYTKEMNILTRKNLPFEELFAKQQQLKTFFKQ